MEHKSLASEIIGRLKRTVLLQGLVISAQAAAIAVLLAVLLFL